MDRLTASIHHRGQGTTEKSLKSWEAPEGTWQALPQFLLPPHAVPGTSIQDGAVHTQDSSYLGTPSGKRSVPLAGHFGSFCTDNGHSQRNRKQGLKETLYHVLLVHAPSGVIG